MHGGAEGEARGRACAQYYRVLANLLTKKLSCSTSWCISCEALLSMTLLVKRMTRLATHADCHRALGAGGGWGGGDVATQHHTILRQCRYSTGCDDADHCRPLNRHTASCRAHSVFAKRRTMLQYCPLPQCSNWGTAASSRQGHHLGTWSMRGRRQQIGLIICIIILVSHL